MNNNNKQSQVLERKEPLVAPIFTDDMYTVKVQVDAHLMELAYAKFPSLMKLKYGIPASHWNAKLIKACIFDVGLKVLDEEYKKVMKE